MNNTELMTKVGRMAHKIGFRLKQKSPEILVIAGVAGTVASAVMACRATLKVNEILGETNATVEAIHDTRKLDGTPSAKDPGKLIEYSEQDERSDLTKVYIQTGVKLAKLYAPAVILGTLSITSILTSHNILRKRNMALAAAYTAVDQSFKEYRNRVVEWFGEQVEKEIRYNIKAKEIEEQETDPETGEIKTVTKFVNLMDGDPTKHSPYARFFDELSPNYTKNAEHNLAFLRGQQSYFNDLLRIRGYVFLNEVYDALGIPPSSAGQVVGWVFDEDSDKSDSYISFGIYDLHSEQVRAFVNGVEKAILLDFNVDGDIQDAFTKYARG